MRPVARRGRSRSGAKAAAVKIDHHRPPGARTGRGGPDVEDEAVFAPGQPARAELRAFRPIAGRLDHWPARLEGLRRQKARRAAGRLAIRSEEHTSELQSLMRSSYAVFCL